MGAVTGIRKGPEIVPVRNDSLEGSIYSEVLAQGYLTSSSFISMRRSAFDLIGDWDQAFPASQDDDICFRLAKHFKIGLIKEMLGLYYMDAGPGNQIGGSPKRVADGWWQLWNKYETDTAALCGKRVIGNHILNCAYRFCKIGNKHLMTESLKKARKYVSTKQYFTAMVRIQY